MPKTLVLTLTVMLLTVVALATPAHGDEAEARRLCALWAASYSYPSGIEQERCRSAFPELAIDYAAYCSRLKAGETDTLSLAACRAHEWRRGEPS